MFLRMYQILDSPTSNYFAVSLIFRFFSCIHVFSVLRYKVVFGYLFYPSSPSVTADRFAQLLPLLVLDKTKLTYFHGASASEITQTKVISASVTCSSSCNISLKFLYPYLNLYCFNQCIQGLSLHPVCVFSVKSTINCLLMDYNLHNAVTSFTNPF